VSRGVAPTEPIRDEIDALFTGDRDLVDVLEEVARLGARLIIQTALEAEVTEFLGRARDQRAASAEDARPGWRNGSCPTTIKTTAGPVTLERPKLRGPTETFASRLLGTGVTKTNALGVAGDRRVRARPVGAGCRGHPRRRARRRGGAVEVDGVAGVRAGQGGVRAVAGTPAR
jgi:putative transposase